MTDTLTDAADTLIAASRERDDEPSDLVIFDLWREILRHSPKGETQSQFIFRFARAVRAL